MKKSSLTIVGTGIKYLCQLTYEACTYIAKSDKVLYLVNDPALEQWIKKTSKDCESLCELYFKHTTRIKSYSAITNYILTHLTESKNICVALYGHPTVFAKPALDAVLKAMEEGIDAKVLPGISAEACLFADLLIDPGTCGCQSFETTDFILHNRNFDVNSHLILWQPDVIGVEGHSASENNCGMNLLCEHLMSFYPAEHEVVIYEAAQYPGIKPKIDKVPLNKLTSLTLSPISTLYVKPLGKSIKNTLYARKLNISN